jgi:hypothetical protein
MSKYLAFVLALLLALTLIYGCQENKAPAEAVDPLFATLDEQYAEDEVAMEIEVVAANVTAEEFEAMFGGTARQEFEADYANAEGLVAVYGLQGSRLGSASADYVEPADYGYLELWANLKSAQKFWREKASKLRNNDAELRKMNAMVQYKFSNYFIESPLEKPQSVPAFIRYTVVDLNSTAKTGEFGNGLDAVYADAKGLIATYKLKGSMIGSSDAVWNKPPDYAYLELWTDANRAEQFWYSEAQGAKSRLLEAAEIRGINYSVEPVRAALAAK